ncbi:MAG: hypothetical protein N2491_10670 [Negativicutes bacterium]|nr:hypothetical protein [Negativicutes bacterium]
MQPVRELCQSLGVVFIFFCRTIKLKTSQVKNIGLGYRQRLIPGLHDYRLKSALLFREQPFFLRDRNIDNLAAFLRLLFYRSFFRFFLPYGNRFAALKAKFRVFRQFDAAIYTKHANSPFALFSDIYSGAKQEIPTPSYREKDYPMKEAVEIRGKNAAQVCAAFFSLPIML